MKKTLWLIIFILCFVAIQPPMALGEDKKKQLPEQEKSRTVYKYINKKGTLVFTDNPNTIPLDRRKTVKKIEMPETKKTPVSENISKTMKKEKNRDMIKKEVHKGWKSIISFFQEQSSVIVAYGTGAILLFFIVPFFLKRFSNSFLFRIFLRIGIMVAFVAGIYTLYLSWISKNILSYSNQISDSRSSTSKKRPGKTTNSNNIMDKTKDIISKVTTSTPFTSNNASGLRSSSSEEETGITTPADIMNKTREIVNEMNTRTKEQENILKELGR